MISASYTSCVQKKLAHKVMCYGVPVTDIGGSFSLYPSKLLLNNNSNLYPSK